MHREVRVEKVRKPKDICRLIVLVDILLLIAALVGVLYTTVKVVTEGSSFETIAWGASALLVLLHINSRYAPSEP